MPSAVSKETITDDQRRARMGLVPREWLEWAGAHQEANIREQMGE